jgi:predicted PurR-regulated permease PerM
MRYKLSSQQKEQTISLAMAGIIVLSFYFLIHNFPVVKQLISNWFSIMLPFVVGFVIAFLVTPIMNWIERKLLVDTRLSSKAKRRISASFSMFVAVGVITLSFWIILPQLISSITQLLTQLPGYVAAAEIYLNELVLTLNIRSEITDVLIGSGEDILQSISTLARDYLPQIITYSWQFASLIFRMLLGLIIAFYILLERERFGLQFKKVSYAILHKQDANRLMQLTEISGKTFNSYLVGKTIDSIIIGILCFIGMNIFNWPYALLISVIIGFTNMIPVFGPFIGAVPGIFILFIVNPMYTLWFALFILVLQQLDGNIIGPLILGDSMGLPSLWIMFAIIVGGGFFGIIGMFIGVPVFAIVYFIVKEIITFRLIEKDIKLEKRPNSDS